MGAFGAIDAMSKSYKSNRDILKRQSRFESQKGMPVFFKNRQARYHHADARFLEAIRLSMKEEKRKEFYTTLKVLGISLFITAGLLWLLVQFLDFVS